MRILKYIFLLLLLSVVALSIFMATQKGDYIVERSKIINAPKATVFNYINDYRNWADFGSWATEDPEMIFNYPQNTIGKGAFYSWEGKEGNGKIQTLFVKENDSISQRMNYNDNTSSVSWKFKDTIGGTKVTWRTEGKMNFLFKVYTAINGGVNSVIGTMYERSLANLDKALDFEIKNYNVQLNGIVKIPQRFYLGQTFTSEIVKINKNFKIVVPKIVDFCNTNNIIVTGKPFIIYHTYDTEKGIANIAICIPINKEIFISAGSDIISGKLEASEMVKTTLTGDYSHLKKANDKAVSFLNKNELKRAVNISFIEIYTKSKSDIKTPSKWITKIYIPLFSSAKPATQPIENSTQTPESESSEVTSTAVEVNNTPVKPGATKPLTPKTTTPNTKAVVPKTTAPKTNTQQENDTNEFEF